MVIEYFFGWFLTVIQLRPVLPVAAPSPMAFLSSRTKWSLLILGRMTIVCQSCKALHWLNERSSCTGSSIQTPIFENCCKKGDVVLEILKPPSDYLKYLLESLETVPRNFRKHIREYNSALTFTSVKYNTDTRVGANGGGISCFQIHGELYHLQGPLVLAIGATPSFAQLYFYDPEYSAQVRHATHPTLDIMVLQRLTMELNSINPFIEFYKTAKERLDNASTQDGNARVILNPRLQLIVETGADKRRNNLPTSNEVAVIIPDEYEEAGFRDIVLAHRNPLPNQMFSIINPNHAAYMPLHYVLLFPNGDTGWHWSLQLRDRLNNRKVLRLGQREFYRYV